MGVDESCHRSRILVAEPARGDEPLNGPSRGIQHVLLQVHAFENICRHAFMHITGIVRNAKDRIEVDGIEVNHFADVTGVLQPFGKLLENGVAK